MADEHYLVKITNSECILVTMTVYQATVLLAHPFFLEISFQKQYASSTMLCLPCCKIPSFLLGIYLPHILPLLSPFIPLTPQPTLK